MINLLPAHNNESLPAVYGRCLIYALNLQMLHTNPMVTTLPGWHLMLGGMTNLGQAGATVHMGVAVMHGQPVAMRGGIRV